LYTFPDCTNNGLHCNMQNTSPLLGVFPHCWNLYTTYQPVAWSNLSCFTSDASGVFSPARQNQHTANRPSWGCNNVVLITLHIAQVYYIMHAIIRLVPRPPPFFVLQFAFSIIHGSGRARKTGKAWSHSSRV